MKPVNYCYNKLDAKGILGPAFSYGVMVVNENENDIKIPFIQAIWCLTGVDSYTISEIKKVREIGRGHFASVLIARHNGEEFVLKKIFCKHWDQEGKKLPKKVKILNDLKIQKR